MQCKTTLFVVPTFLRGPRTIDFCNNLYFNKIQIWLVRGPSHIGLPSVILMPVSPPYSHSGDMHPNNATEGRVSRAYLDIFVEICSPMMPLGAYITDRRRISPVLPSTSAREDAFLACIGRWRRSRSRFLRGELSFYAQRRGSVDVSAHGPFNICSVWHHLCAEASVRQRLCALVSYKGCCFGRPSEQIYLGKRLPARASYNSCVSIDCFSCKIMPFFNFSHRLLQVILFSMTTGLYTHIRIKSKAGRPSRAALPR